MHALPSPTPPDYRTIWISDVHLGSRGCQAELLLEFLKQHPCERLYLVGDIIDVWALRRGIYWPQAHNNVLRFLLGASRQGTEVIYIPCSREFFRKKRCNAPTKVARTSRGTWGWTAARL